MLIRFQAVLHSRYDEPAAPLTSAAQAGPSAPSTFAACASTCSAQVQLSSDLQPPHSFRLMAPRSSMAASAVRRRLVQRPGSGPESDPAGAYVRKFHPRSETVLGSQGLRSLFEVRSGDNVIAIAASVRYRRSKLNVIRLPNLSHGLYNSFRPSPTQILIP
eukprot:g47551.t1